MDESQIDDENGQAHSKNGDVVPKQKCSIEDIVNQVTAKPTKKYIFMMLGLMCFNMVGDIYVLMLLQITHTTESQCTNAVRVAKYKWHSVILLRIL